MSRWMERRVCSAGRRLAQLAGLTAGLVLAVVAMADESAAKPKVELKTDLGIVVIELFPEQAPKTVANFIKLVKDGYYSGVIFHRVIPDFVAQTGGYTFDFQDKPKQDTVPNESDNGLKNTRGTVAMARRRDPDSAAAQFYVNLKDNPNLDATESAPGYTVFGTVVEGFDVVQKIAEEPRGQYRSFPDAPNVPVRILKAQLLNKQILDDKASQ